MLTHKMGYLYAMATPKTIISPEMGTIWRFMAFCFPHDQFYHQVLPHSWVGYDYGL